MRTIETDTPLYRWIDGVARVGIGAALLVIASVCLALGATISGLVLLVLGLYGLGTGVRGFYSALTD